MKKLFNLFFTLLAVGLHADVCDTSKIYEDGYEYSLPESFIKSYLSGKAFDNPTVYNEDEAKNLHDDINNLYEKILSANPVREKIAVITAGAPGAGKTIKMRQDLEGKNFAYIDPDDVCLKNMPLTYLAQIGKEGNTRESWFAAYNKWRPGSNAACQLILANLIREGYAFYYGTTATAVPTAKFFAFLKKQGYTIRLLHVTAPDDVRWNSIAELEKTFIHLTEQDIRAKGLLPPQRISDTYLAYADVIEFYYRGAVQEDAILTATWTRIDNSEMGKLEIIDRNRYELIKKNHDSVAEKLNRFDLTWEMTLEKSSLQVP